MVSRYLRAEVEEALADTPVVFLRGARQTGKSTLAREMLGEGAQYVTFDDETVRASAELDMQAFARSLPHGSVVDEVQRLPELFPTIKLLIDEERVPGRLLLTGSADVTAIPRVAESLSGRVAPLTLYPFAAAELQQSRPNFLQRIADTAPLKSQILQVEPDFLLDRLLRGGYPEALERKTDKRRAGWFDAYVETIVQRDIDVLSEVEGLAALPRLLELLGHRVGNLLNRAEVSRTLGLPASTATRYLSLLRATFLVDLVPAWSNNATVRLRKAPKVFLNDTGLAAHLRGDEVSHQALLRDGSLLENFVANELRKLISWSPIRFRLSHYRQERSYEVDFVLERGRALTIGIEVKASTTLSSSDAAGLLRLGGLVQTEQYRGILLYGGDKVLPFGERVWAVPIAALWVPLM